MPASSLSSELFGDGTDGGDGANPGDESASLPPLPPSLEPSLGDGGSSSTRASPSDIVAGSLFAGAGVGEFDYELDPVNRNPVVLAALRVIDAMHGQYHAEWGVPDPADPVASSAPIASASTAMPKWMDFLLQRLRSSESSHHVHVLILKLLVARPRVFGPWGQRWLLAVVDSCNVLASECAGWRAAFHYFLRDVCVLLVQWEGVRPSNAPENVAASTFVNHLVSVAAYPREAVWRTNLRLIAGLVRSWGQGLRLDKMALLHMLNRADNRSASFLSPGDRVVATSLTVFAMLLSNQLPVLDRVHDTAIPADKFFDMFAKGLLAKVMGGGIEAGVYLGCADSIMLCRSRAVGPHRVADGLGCVNGSVCVWQKKGVDCVGMGLEAESSIVLFVVCVSSAEAPVQPLRRCVWPHAGRGQGIPHWPGAGQ